MAKISQDKKIQKKKKVDKYNFINIKTSYSSKDTILRKEQASHSLGKYTDIYVTKKLNDKGLLSH